MLDADTKRRIDTCRDILVGKVPDPKSQVEQITIALIYKFMDDMDAEAEELGGKRAFFAGDFGKYGWAKLMAPNLGGYDVLTLYSEAIGKMNENPGVPPLFREIFKNAYLPYRDPETLRSFLKEIHGFTYDHSERLGDAFEYLLSVLGSQGDAGQFRTPRHIIDFMVALIDPQKEETILDPACGTAGFLISAYKHVLKANGQERPGDRLTPEERKRLAGNFHGYDISPDMVRLSLVNLYLHGFANPQIVEYDTLTSEDKWHEYADVILANPPFMSPKGGIKPHKRFSVQANRSEVLFVDYMAEHLTPTGRAAIVVPEGIIFQSGTAYKQLRKLLVEHYLVAVISLPAGVFNPYSGVKTSILLLDRRLAKKSDSLLFAKVEHDGFGLGAQRRVMEKNDLPALTQAIRAWLDSLRTGGEFDIPSTPNLHLVERTRIGENGEWNLSGERYGRDSIPEKHTYSLAKIAEVCERVSEAVDPTSLTGKVNYIGLENIESDTGVLTGTIVAEYEHIKSLKFRFMNGDILYGKLRPNLNKVYLAKFSGICSTDIFVLRPKAMADAQYVSCLLRSPQFNIEVLKGLGGAQLPRVSFDYLSDLQIPLPPLAVQQEIVAEITSYQQIIDGARQVVEHYRPRIAIDPAWPVVPLGEVATKVQYGLSEKLNTEGLGYKTFRMNELVAGYAQDNGMMKYSNISDAEFVKYKLNRGDILFNRTNSIEHVGRTAIFDLEGDYCFASYLIRIVLAEQADPFYINLFMNTQAFQTGIKQFASQAIGQANINATSLQAYNIPLPDLATQRAIVAEIAEEQRLVAANHALIERFTAKIGQVIARVWGE